MEDAHLEDNEKTRHQTDTLRCLIHWKAGQLSKAEEACSRAIQIVEEHEDNDSYSAGFLSYKNKSAWQAYAMRSAIRAEQGRINEAEADEFRMVQLFGHDPNILNRVGYGWAERGTNLPCAVDLLQDAVEEEPENPAFLDSLGWAYFRAGDIERAARLIDQSIAGFGDEPEPGLAETLMNQGDIHWHLGEKDQARAAWQKASDTLDDCGCKPEHLLSKLALRVGQSDPKVRRPVEENDQRDLKIVGIGTRTYSVLMPNLGGSMSPETIFNDYVFFDNGES